MCIREDEGKVRGGEGRRGEGNCLFHGSGREGREGSEGMSGWSRR